METGGGKRPLMNELTQGRELANQLKNHLDKTSSCESLVEKILCSYEKALSLLHNNIIIRGSSAFAEAAADTTCIGVEFSPRTTHVSDPAAAADSDSCDKNVSKKRRKLGMGKWSEQVKVCSGTGIMVEAGPLPLPLSDGYSWRKYGQKDILGANHPRSTSKVIHPFIGSYLSCRMATLAKPEKKCHIVDKKEKAPGGVTEVQKLDLDCGCFRYRSVNIIRGGKLKKLMLIDTQDRVELRRPKEKVEVTCARGASGCDAPVGRPQYGYGDGTGTSGCDAPVGRRYGDYMPHVSSDENPNESCVTM